MKFLGISDQFVKDLLVSAIAPSSLFLVFYWLGTSGMQYEEACVWVKWHPIWGTACPKPTGIKTQNKHSLCLFNMESEKILSCSDCGHYKHNYFLFWEWEPGALCILCQWVIFPALSTGILVTIEYFVSH